MAIVTRYSAALNNLDLQNPNPKNMAGPAVKLHFIGDVINTDQMQDYSLTGLNLDASANANITSIATGAVSGAAYAVTSAAATPDTGTIPTFSEAPFIFYVAGQCVTVGAFFEMRLGSISGTRCYLTTSGLVFQGDSASCGSYEYPSSPVNGEDLFFAGYYDGAGSTHFIDSRNGATISAITETDTGLSPGDFTFSNVISLSNAVAQAWYGFGLWVFTSTPTTTQYLSWMNHMQTSLIGGDKTLPDDLVYFV